MQALSAPSSTQKRKQACKSCRQRKKRCNGERPSCTLCSKWGIQCEYSIPALARDTSIDVSLIPPESTSPRPCYNSMPIDAQISMSQDLSQPIHFSTNSLFGTPHPVALQDIDYPTPESILNASLGDGAQPADHGFALPAELPPDGVLIELIELFFVHIYDMLPCFHKGNLLQQIENRYLQTEAPLLLYAMSSLAAQFHHNPTIKGLQNDWYEQAKFQYELTSRDPKPALRTLQAVLCLELHSCIKGDFSTTTLIIGKAWRQICALGLNRMDSDHIRLFQLQPDPQTAAEKEECRRTLWLLLILDRELAWPTGWPHAIDDRQFMVNIPVHEEEFQALDNDTIDTVKASSAFTRNLSTLISRSSAASEPLNMIHYIGIAHVLMGRIAEHLHSLHDSPDDPEYAEECRRLDDLVVRFRLSLPRSATTVLEAAPEKRGHVIWLVTIVNTMAILLHFRVADVDRDQETFDHLKRALIAAKSTINTVKDASRISVDLLLNVHIMASLYLASAVLIINWRLTGDPSMKGDIELISLIFDRVYELYMFPGLKFKLALKHDLGRDMEDIIDLRDRGFKGLMADCTKWTFVRDYVEKYGVKMVKSLDLG